jgi:hypothetical protein
VISRGKKYTNRKEMGIKKMLYSKRTAHACTGAAFALASCFLSGAAGQLKDAFRNWITLYSVPQEITEKDTQQKVGKVGRMGLMWRE